MAPLDDKPLELLPWGQTREGLAKLQARKEAGRAGFRGCLFQLVAIALAIMYVCGWMAGKDSVNESTVQGGHKEMQR